ncbi:hypothetical protein P153DRAFT_252837, partial [Dothidotthia symphoricarpi CBS 119687]
RKRTKPLIPEPFHEVSMSRQRMMTHSPRTVRRPCKFCPDLDVMRYSAQLSEEKNAELVHRADRLSRRAILNHHFEASEFNWEADAWHDVFGLIREDDTLRMFDKRPYEFVETDEHDNVSVKRRIPDATMGLRSYDSLESLDHPCKVDHKNKKSHESLLKKRLRAQMRDPDSGLIVDGIWGESNLLFPFAVYEAKKRATTWEQAENQIQHACLSYLAMLDDLARDPTDVTRYQSQESDGYQVFAFTSCGSYWQVYIAWNCLGYCHMDTIWEGDVRQFTCAAELIYIMEQVHGYAANQHREFVINHLEPW